jgi:NDP-sugar pyrophosphorylase family protein
MKIEAVHNYVFPKKAFVLAAGFGTRMLPLSLEKPKPMFPVWGKPVIAHTLEMLIKWGVEEVVINLHYNPSSIVNFVVKNFADKLRVNFSFEPQILGTGGALKKVETLLGKRPFWLINADIAVELNPEKIVRTFYSWKKIMAVLWMHPEAGPRTVELGTNGDVLNFRSCRPGTEGTYTFCGLHLISPEILNFIPADESSSIIQSYILSQNSGFKVKGVCLNNTFWADIGTPVAYLNAHKSILAAFVKNKPGKSLFRKEQLECNKKLKQSGCKLEGFVAAGKNVKGEKGVFLRNAILWDGVELKKGAFVEDAIVGSYASINSKVRRIALKIDTSFARSACESVAVDPMLRQCLEIIKWNINETTIIPFEPRGSARSFTRVKYRKRTAIFMRYSAEREENILYTSHARLLKKAGINVPAIIVDAPQQRYALLQDLGDISLQEIINKSANEKNKIILYKRVLKEMLKLYTVATRYAKVKKIVTMPPFSEDLFRWEHEFFAKRFLIDYAKVEKKIVARILRELRDVSSVLLTQRQVLLHRDLQSSNVLFLKNKPYLVDFQGMRFGPVSYDIASLLFDPYVCLAETIQLEMLNYFNLIAPAPLTLSPRLFYMAAVQRLAQALGAYGRLVALADTAYFSKYIPPALQMMRRALFKLQICPYLHSVIDALL